jgi:formylglycine-generating enzyme required for sulfatase activity
MIEQPYSIDIYPVTNREFDAFIRAGGYQNNKYWIGANPDKHGSNRSQ